MNIKFDDLLELKNHGLVGDLSKVISRMKLESDHDDDIIFTDLGDNSIYTFYSWTSLLEFLKANNIVD